MKLPILNTLNRQDFPEAPAWISKLLYPLQLFMTNVLTALNKQLTLQDNMSCVIKQISMVADATDSNNTVSFSFNLSRQPIEVTVSVSRTDGNYEVVYPQVSWNYINNNIVVNGIKGLTAGKQYLVTFKAI